MLCDRYHEKKREIAAKEERKKDDRKEVEEKQKAYTQVTEQRDSLKDQIEGYSQQVDGYKTKMHEKDKLIQKQNESLEVKR